MSARRSWQDRQAAIARQPGECALHHPALPPQPRLVLHALAGDAVGDPPSPQGGAAVPDVVALVRVQRRRAAAGPPARAFNGFRRVEQRREDRAVGAVRPRQPRRERDAPAADHQMALRVGSPRGSAAVRRVLADRSPPFSPGGSRYRRSPATSRSGRPRRGDRGGGGGAGARPPPRPSRAVAASRSSRSRSPTPAAGVPRGSRPAHIADTHQRRAIRHARAAPLGLGGSGGSNDRIAARRSSVTTSCALMPGDRAATAPRLC